MLIDPSDGTVTLPAGCSISPLLSQDVFRKHSVFPRARSRDFGTLPWIHYHFSGGVIEGKELLASLCFYDQVLVYVSLAADFNPPGAKDWSSYSLDVEAAAKQFHDRLLEQEIGKPTRRDRLSVGNLPASQTTLACPLTWKFPWGRVCSGHDFKGGGTFITISFGNRQEEANRAYRRLGEGPP